MDKRGGGRFLQDETLAAISNDCFDLQLDAADRKAALSRVEIWRSAYADMEAVEVAGIEPAFLLTEEA